MKNTTKQIHDSFIPDNSKPQKSEQSYLSDKGVAARYDVSRATIWRWAAEGRIPKPVKIIGSTRWRMTDLLIWEEMEVAQQ